MKSFIFTVFLAASAASVSVWGHDAHVHGAARLDVVVDGPVLSLQLESPLDNLLGFEHEPRNKAEQDKAARMAAKLRATEKLFVPTPDAACKPEQVSLASSALTPELLGEQASEHADAHTNAHANEHAHKHAAAAHAEEEEEEAEEEGHADLDASWQFRCAHPEALRGVEVRLFQAFPGFQEIEAQVAGPRGQHGAHLTPKKRTLAW
jgi:hypothetical protein